MNGTPTYLRNSEAVVKAFGYWPSFHDSLVVAFRYDGSGSGTVEFALHGWEMTSEVDERGFFKLIKHHLVLFAFRDIFDVDLDQFTHDNILFGLKLSPAEEFHATGKFSVDLDSAMGGDLRGSFSARSGQVLEVVACDRGGRATETGVTPNGGPARQPGHSDVQEVPTSLN